MKIDNANMEELKRNTVFFLSLIVLCVVLSQTVMAGTDATFDAWVDQLTDWIEGSLGKGVSIAFVIIGIIMGIAQQTLKAVAIGVGCALGLNFTPTVISAMFTATLL
ncbi:TraA family conjugative transfer protein [Psychromonas aquimarina]|uniref:TraA family conjugative transfer protein n=1 Tax=Psychromonas aquimarina TaxID=444919 RepID=UPI0004010D9F|nr:TraA family conjugative transfer protein [Psychromonas aquimarina]